MKNILVAGGAGFIGSHLCECLLHQGHQIICLDNFRTGSLKNVSPLMNNPCFKLVEHDITMPYKIQGINEIYNLACPASPVHYQVSPVETVKTSFIGTLNLLELAHDNQCKLSGLVIFRQMILEDVIRISRLPDRHYIGSPAFLCMKGCKKQ